MEQLKGTYIIYGISDCPACLRACAAAMELYPTHEYVFVNTDFSKTHRERLKLRYGVETSQSLFLKKMVAKRWWEVMMNSQVL